MPQCQESGQSSCQEHSKPDEDSVEGWSEFIPRKVPDLRSHWHGHRIPLPRSWSDLGWRPLIRECPAHRPRPRAPSLLAGSGCCLVQDEPGLKGRAGAANRQLMPGDSPHTGPGTVKARVTGVEKLLLRCPERPWRGGRALPCTRRPRFCPEHPMGLPPEHCRVWSQNPNIKNLPNWSASQGRAPVTQQELPGGSRRARAKSKGFLGDRRIPGGDGRCITASLARGPAVQEGVSG